MCNILAKWNIGKRITIVIYSDFKLKHYKFQNWHSPTWTNCLDLGWITIVVR